ncbi:MAG: c-type cytochrome biogenesis protein CcmI [Ectothiorhodospiraceae bacterium]|jgi:cytochrome c-type biogenesis protein CcmH
MWLFGLILALLCILALAFVVVPLMRRGVPAGSDTNQSNIAIYRRRLEELQADVEAGTIDADAFEEAKSELDRELLGDLSEPVERGDRGPARRGRRGGIVAASVMIPVTAVVFYFWLGDPGALNPAPAISGDRAEAVKMIRDRIDSLEERAKANPDDQMTWKMLGQAYMILERPQDAASAFGHALNVGDQTPELLTDRARALAVAAGGRFAGEPRLLLDKALELQGNNPRVLWFAGLAAAQGGETDRARRLWGQLLGQLPPNSEVAGRLKTALDRLPGGGAAAVSDAQISVDVRLAPDLAKAYPPETTVYVLARAVDGPRMPLAVRKVSLGELPITVTLDDSLAMSPQLRLSQFKQVEIVARVSPSGQAMAQAGDLEGRAGPVAVSKDASADVVVDKRLD